MNKTQDDIINAIKFNKNDIALSLLYKQSLPKVIQVVKKYNGNKEDGEDVFQDVVITLFRLVRENKLKENSDLNALIYTIAKNNWLRKLERSKKIEHSDDLSSFKEINDQNGLESSLILKERNEFLAKSFALLNESCQELISSIYFERLSLHEISGRLGFKNADVAKAMHYKCKKKLLNIINQNPSFSEALK